MNKGDQGMNEDIDELERLLNAISVQHGTIQDINGFRRVRDMYTQARQCLARIRKRASELQEEYDDLQGSYMEMTEYFF